ncbi:MAG: ATP-dependent RNA helicase dbp7 [Sclerophora amabilis]|nr:MAG: ATP-dependent RNA helicase dbp7 [Sclerophora amabilis]
MADTDGMLLNFSIGEGPLNVNPTFKGGRWRDRLSAKKFARHRALKSGIAPKPVGQLVTGEGSTLGGGDSSKAGIGESISQRPSKRQRLDRDTTGTTASGGGNAGHHRPTEKPHQVISSLFSFNPESNTTGSKDTDPEYAAKPSNAPMIDGISTFTTLNLCPSISAHLLTKLGLKAPTAIQKKTIPQLVTDDSDAFIQAQTGSGKTLAYLLPIVQRIMAISENVANESTSQSDGKVHRNSGLFAIILAPTRELCKQIFTVLDRLLHCAHWIVAGAVIGGEKKKSEKARLRKGLNVLVATPGRLADHLDNTEVLDVSNVRWLVMDEGDRLMELGFEEEIKGIVKKIVTRSKVPSAGGVTTRGLPSRRVTILCSATMKMNVQRLGEISLQDAVHFKADAEGDETSETAATQPNHDEFSTPAQLKQSFAVIPAKLRLVALNAVLQRAFARRGSVMRAIVFMSCADSVNFHFQVFTRPEDDHKPKDETQPSEPGSDGKPEKVSDMIRSETTAPMTGFTSPDNQVNMCKLHGSLAQAVRTSTLAAFSRSKDPAVLVCTDVASRGLDLPNVDIVIEYDPPYSKDDHLHRVGRTARAGKDGRALIFLLPGDEEGYVSVLKEVYRDGGKGLARNEANEILKKGFLLTPLQPSSDPSGPRKLVSSNNTPGWEHQATAWQLDVERWALGNPRHLDLARRAFQSHVRAYATHTASERSFFNIKTLHLGHLAKSFGLRDRPGNININVPGLRSNLKDGGRGRNAGDKRRMVGVSSTHGVSDKDGEQHEHQHQHQQEQEQEQDRGQPTTGDVAAAAAAATAKKKMRKRMQEHMSGISEFNIG